MIFRDKTHESAYNELCGRMKYLDSYHRSLAYLLSLDTNLRKHIDEVFDFGEDGIKCEGLRGGWQTDTSKRTTRLAFNLWNGCCDDGETYTDKDGYQVSLPSNNYTPAQLFGCEYAPYFWQAIQLRYE